MYLFTCKQCGVVYASYWQIVARKSLCGRCLYIESEPVEIPAENIECISGGDTPLYPEEIPNKIAVTYILSQLWDEWKTILNKGDNHGS